MKKAFTLIEIIIVIVILGVVASLAIPRMTGTTEQAILSEAVSALESLHAAEKRYELEHGTGVFARCADLDIVITPRNFNNLNCNNLGSVSMRRIGGAYTITKNINGSFSCPACPASLRLPN